MHQLLLQVFMRAAFADPALALLVSGKRLLAHGCWSRSPRSGLAGPTTRKEVELASQQYAR